jgi:hypothetical protein
MSDKVRVEVERDKSRVLLCMDTQIGGRGEGGEGEGRRGGGSFIYITTIYTVIPNNTVTTNYSVQCYSKAREAMSSPFCSIQENFFLRTHFLCIEALIVKRINFKRLVKSMHEVTLHQHPQVKLLANKKIKNKTKFSSYMKKLGWIGCKVIYA